MKRTILFLLAVTTAVSSLFGQITKNPFSKLGYKKQIMYTSSKGEFEEFHGNPDVVEIGSVYFNTKTNKVVGYLNEEKEKAEVASATSAMSVDPLCEKYYWISPYAFCLNNPVRFIDPDGRVVRDEKGSIVYTTNGQTATYTHPSGNSATLEIGYIFADDGTPIQVLNNNQGGSAGWSTNCHGTTFADGKFWLNNDQVPALVAGDGYKSQTVSTAKEGDKIIYLGEGNEAEHSMTITKTDGSAKGMIVYGQGGLEVENHTDKATEAWPGAKAAAIVRKETPDKVVTTEEAKKLKENAPQN